MKHCISESRRLNFAWLSAEVAVAGFIGGEKMRLNRQARMASDLIRWKSEAPKESLPPQSATDSASNSSFEVFVQGLSEHLRRGGERRVIRRNKTLVDTLLV